MKNKKSKIKAINNSFENECHPKYEAFNTCTYN